MDKIPYVTEDNSKNKPLIDLANKIVNAITEASDNEVCNDDVVTAVAVSCKCASGYMNDKYGWSEDEHREWAMNFAKTITLQLIDDSGFELNKN